MPTIAQKLQALANSKEAIRQAIVAQGVACGTEIPLNQYAAKIALIEGDVDTDGMNGYLAYESKTLETSASTTTTINYSPKCGVIDENNVLWDVLDWHERWVDNGYSASGLSKPIGIWMEALGMSLKFLWPIVMPYTLYEVSGTNSIGTASFKRATYINTFITTARTGTAYPAKNNIAHGTAGKYKSSSWSATLNGDGIDLYSANTLETFHVPNRSLGNQNSLSNADNEKYIEAYYKHCEFYRACFAICSGVATPTGTANGTTATVDILNASGQQAAVGEDMYFWVNGTNTGLLAKYNLNSRLIDSANAYYLTSAIADSIYSKQKASGVNMNDTGINSSTIHVLSVGAKGAEAIAVDGYWYIKTPTITYPNASATTGQNIPDAPLVDACKHYGFTCPSMYMLLPFFMNKSTILSAIVNLLTTVEGFSGNIAINSYSWTALPNTNGQGWVIALSNGQIMAANNMSNYSFIPVPLKSTVFTVHSSS